MLKITEKLRKGFVLQLVFVLGACSSPSIRQTFVDIGDLRAIPQTPDTVLSNFNLSEEDEALIHVKQSTFLKSYFHPWDKDFAFNHSDYLADFKGKAFYGANLRAYPKEWLESIFENANFGAFQSANSLGIIIQTTDLRGLPTWYPGFFKPDEPGEGFPFDYLQESQIYLGSPVRVSHFSKDKAWAFIRANDSTVGWIRTDSVAMVSPRQVKWLKSLSYAVFLEDNKPIYDAQKNFLSFSRLGSRLPISQRFTNKGEKDLKLFYPVRKNDRSVTFEKVSVSDEIAASSPLSLNMSNVRNTMQKLIGVPYGWGTYLGYRDCSALVKDFYSVFDIHLPRNSSAQIRDIKSIDLKNRSVLEKEEIIRAQALPFLTLLHLPGHIAIYMGLFKDKPLIFHSVWAVDTEHGENTGRNVIGNAILSTIHYGDEVPYFSSHLSFMKRLDAIGFVHHSGP